jgi:hypothetical protein
MNFMFRTKAGNVFNLDAVIALRRVPAKNGDHVYHWLDTMKDEAIMVSPEDFYELQEALFDSELRLAHYKQSRAINDAVFRDGFEPQGTTPQGH